MDKHAVDRSLALDEAWAGAARSSWTALMDLVVWGDFEATSPGTMPRVRKRALDAGERVRSMFANRDWIPHPRERVKNALATFLNLSRSLDELERAISELTGGEDLGALRMRCAELRDIEARLGPAAARWTVLLESQFAADGD